MLHQCPECGSRDVRENDSGDIRTICCNNCNFCWAGYKEGAYKESEDQPLNNEPASAREPEP